MFIDLLSNLEIRRIFIFYIICVRNSENVIHNTDINALYNHKFHGYRNIYNIEFIILEICWERKLLMF